MDRRGQIYTLEGLFAGLIILTGVFFALQATTTTPGDVGTSPHSIQQDRATVNDLMTVVEEETLEDTLRYWDTNGQDDFHCAPPGVTYYPGISTSCPPYNGHVPPTEFGELLDQRLGDAYSYNVVVTFNETGGEVGRQRVVYQGNPGLGAARATTTVTLEDDDLLLDQYHSESTTTVLQAHNNDEFYAPKITEGDTNVEISDTVFNVFRVEVSVWRA